MGQVNRMRKLVEGLPGPANWTSFAKYTIIQSANCKTFAQQCLSNTEKGAQSPGRPSGHRKRGTNSRRTTTLAEVLSWEPLGRRHHRIVTCMYVFLIIKYRLISLISDKFGYLDCMILGRFRFIGRINKISGEIASIFLICFLLFRWAIHLYVPKFKFFALEFLMRGHEARDAGHPGAPMQPANESVVTGDEKEFREQFYRVKRPKRALPLEWDEWPAGSEVNSIVYLKNPFDVHRDRWFLRPNRTRESWLTLSWWTKFMLYNFALMTALSVGAWCLILGGSIQTNLGFEMSYPACVSWLRNIQAAPQPPDEPNRAFNNYSHIYLAPRVLAHEIPIDDIPARIPMNARDLQTATLYTLVRIALDILENLVIFAECIAIFAAQFYLLAINSLDVILNANAIKARLLGLLAKLETRMSARRREETCAECYSSFIAGAQQSDHLSLRSHDRKMSAPITWTPSWTSNHAHRFSNITNRATIRVDNAHDGQLQAEIVELQAILADHFHIITRGYNQYVSFSLGFMCLCWLLFTVAICIWMKSIRSRAVELEFLIAETNVTVFILSLTIGAAVVRSRNLQLYSLITSVMALDLDFASTKARWTTILKYFYPMPFYSFTIFGSTEISLLLGLKIISWILSAFIVLANFFYTSTI